MQGENSEKEAQNKQKASKPKPQFFMNIRVLTWHKDTHNLFDYEDSLNVDCSEYKFPLQNQKLNLFRSKKKSRIENESSSQQKPNDSDQCIGSIQLTPKIQSNRIIIKIEGKEKPGIIVRHVKGVNREQKGYAIGLGQLIVLGKVKYLVREINKLTISQPLQNKIIEEVSCERQEEDQIKQVLLEQNEANNDKITCRVCLDSLETEKDPLLSPCRCTGSCKFIHFQCLKQWLKTRVKVITRDHAITYERIECEICKASLPISLQVNSKYHQILPIQRPAHENYLLLEKVSEIKNKNLLILRNLPLQGVSMGRDSSCYIKVSDISVSRVHAFIKQVDGQFLLFDNKSKFGTLVSDSSITLELGKTSRGIQLGRTVAIFHVSKQEFILSGKI